MRRLLITIFVALGVSGCTSFNMDFTPEDLADLSQIAPRADGGPSITVFDSSRSLHIEPLRYSTQFDIGQNFTKALDGSGYFSSVEYIKRKAGYWEDEKKLREVAEAVQNEGIVIHLDNKVYDNRGAVHNLTAIAHVFTLGVFPHRRSGATDGFINIYLNGELLTEWEINNSLVTWKSFVPTAYALGQKADVTGEAYAAVLATHAINEMHKLNLL